MIKTAVCQNASCEVRELSEKSKGKGAKRQRYSEKYGADRPNPYTGYLPPGSAGAGAIYHPEAIDPEKLKSMRKSTAASSRELAEKNEGLLGIESEAQSRTPQRRRRELVSVVRSGHTTEERLHLEEIKNEAAAEIREQKESEPQTVQQNVSESSALPQIPQIVTMPDGRLMLASPGKDENGALVIRLIPVEVVENEQLEDIPLDRGIEMLEANDEVPVSQTAEELMHKLLCEIEQSETVLVHPQERAKYPNGAPMFENRVPLYPDGSPMYKNSMPLYPNGSPMYVDDIPVLSDGSPAFESGENEFAPGESVMFESTGSVFDEASIVPALEKEAQEQLPESGEDEPEDDSDIKIAPSSGSRRFSKPDFKYTEEKQEEGSLKVVSDLGGEKKLKSSGAQDETLFIRKERPENKTAVFELPDGVKLPAYIDDDEFLEKWLDEGEGMNINEKRKKRRTSAIIGTVTMVFALIGFIWVVKYTLGALSGIGNTDAKKLKYEEFISPVVMSEVEEFETWSTISQSKLLQSAVFQVLMNMTESSYSTDDTNKLIIPSNDVLEAARTLYGSEVELDINAYNELNSDEFYYSDTDDCFHVAATGISGPQPDVVSITRHGDEITLVVGYLDEASIGTVTEDSYYKTLVFILSSNDDGGYYISAIRRQTES